MIDDDMKRYKILLVKGVSVYYRGYTQRGRPCVCVQDHYPYLDEQYKQLLK